MKLPRLPERYAVDRALGKGATGMVYAARDVRLGIPVAVKLTHTHLAEDKRFRRLFAREIRLSARLIHDAIVPLHDAGFASDNTPFLAMALADAGSFATFREKPPAWGELKRLILEVLDALAYIHSRGVLHRDLKPENVLLHHGHDERLHAWVADLGAANLSEDMPREQVIGGTPMYMAPEQAAGDVAVLSPTADLYALCAMLKEFLTGEAPFAGRNLVELQEAKERQESAWRPRAGYDVPAGLLDIINNQLRIEPLERYDLAADLRNALLALPSLEDEYDEDGPPTLKTLSEVLAPPPVQPGASRWLRPAPPLLPSSPPREPGQGYQARASLSLFLVRQPALVGRDNLRQHLWDTAAQVMKQKAPQVVILVGEAGAGKSRLVESLASRLEEGGWMERLELRHQDPPGPTDGLAGALVRWLRPTAGSRLPVHVRAAKLLSRWRNADQAAVQRDALQLARRASGGEGGAARADIRWLLYEYLEAHAWRGGVLLWLEDIQWAEEDEGLAFVEALMRTRGTRPIPALVVVTVRSESLEDSPTLRTRLEALTHHGAERIDVPRMGEHEIRQVLEEYLTLEPALLDQVARRCGGNPLFAHQLLEEWAQGGHLVDKGGLRYGLAPGLSVDELLPTSTEALLKRRVDSFVTRTPQPDKTRWALHLAALAGKEAPVTLLEAVLGPSWSRELLAASNLLREEPPNFRFDHQLMQHTLQREADLRQDASQLHLTLARAWLALERKGFKGHDLRLAGHLRKGGRPLDAVDRCLGVAEAAWKAGELGLLEDAADLARQSGDEGHLLPGDQRVVQARRLRALALARRGRLLEAASIHRELLNETRNRGDLRREEQHLRDLAGIFLVEGQLSEAEDHYNSALTLARGRMDGVAIAAALRGKAEIETRRGRSDAARQLLEEAVSLARRGGSREETAWALAGLARVRLVVGGNLRAEEALAREALELAEQEGHDQLVGICQQLLAEIVKARGDLATARMRYRTCVRFFSERGLADATATSLLNLALLELTQGRPDPALLYAADATRWLEAAPSHWLRPVASLYQAVAMAQRGLFDEARQLYQQARSQGLGRTVDTDFAAPLGQLAVLALRAGEHELAREAGELSADVWSRLGDEGEERQIRKLLSTLH